MKYVFYEIITLSSLVSGIIATVHKSTFDNYVYFLMIISLTFIIFVSLLLKYSRDKIDREFNFAEKVFEKKHSKINSDVVNTIKTILGRRDK